MSIASDEWPVPRIAHQNQTTLPVVDSGTLVDDLTALVDDPSALVGGQASINTDMILKAKNIIPRGAIRKQR